MACWEVFVEPSTAVRLARGADLVQIADLYECVVGKVASYPVGMGVVVDLVVDCSNGYTGRHVAGVVAGRVSDRTHLIPVIRGRHLLRQ